MKINTKDSLKNKLVNARGMDTVMYSVRIPHELLNGIRREAKKSFMPTSAVIRFALLSYLEANKE